MHRSASTILSSIYTAVTSGVDQGMLQDVKMQAVTYVAIPILWLHLQMTPFSLTHVCHSQVEANLPQRCICIYISMTETAGFQPSRPDKRRFVPTEAL